MCVCLCCVTFTTGVWVTHQTVHTAQRVIGVVQGVGQLVDTVVGLAVAIETHAHCNAAERGNRKGQVRFG